MEQTGIKPQVIEEIRTFARKYEVERVILFGSRARGDYDRASDIDLAVSGGDMERFSTAIEEETSTLLEFDIIDLGQPLQKGFLDSIWKEGIVLYEKV